MKGKFIVCLLLGIVILSNSSYAQSDKKFIRLGDANTESFDDGWLFKRFGLQPDGSNLEEPKEVESVNFNDASWQKLSLPHDWAISGPFRIDLAGETGKLPWKGIGWYRKHFTISKSDAEKNIYIDFDGAMAYAEIWLNGKYVGTWPYGYTSFRMDLSPFLIAGKENVLAVKLNTEKWDSRWYPGAGIYRHVWLVKTNDVHVAHWGTYITTPSVSATAAMVKISSVISNDHDKTIQATISTQIFEAGNNNTLGANIANSAEEKILINPHGSAPLRTMINIKNPKLWSIEHPNRYFAKTIVSVNGKVSDVYYSTFGIRTIQFTANNGFLLNGNRVKIQGVCNHHDLGALGAAINTSALRRQLILLKEMGCNALRTAHNPPAPELLELADEMGFLVWDEAFDCWKHGKKENDYNKLYDEWHQKDLVNLVQRDRNHPCVFIWSIGNEVLDQKDPTMTKALADIIRKEDPTRPVSNGYNDPDGGRETGAAAELDIMGVNYNFRKQTYWDTDPRYANKPTIGSETSSCISSRGEYFFGKLYQNWQVTSYDLAKPDWGCIPDSQFHTNAQLPNLLGEFVWTGFDYLGEPTPYNSDETNLLNYTNDTTKKEALQALLEDLKKKSPPSRSSYFGMIDMAGFPKDRYYLYQSQWRPELPMAHILPHWNWPERIDSMVPVHVYTTGDEAELFLNGKSLGKKTKRQGEAFRLVWNNVTYEPGELRVVAYKNGKEWATDIVKTTGDAVKLNLSTNTKQVANNGEELVFITLRVQDKNGLTVPRSNPQIQFIVEGDGELVASDNGDATSFESFQSSTKKAFNGMALLIVKAKKGNRNMFKVKAISQGLLADAIAIDVK